ncbi:MAG: hypothetical protein WDN26_24290 [Chitinophagaceae bacterium]
MFTDQNINIANNGTTVYKVGTNSVSLDVYGNIHNTVSLSDLIPDAGGNITFTMSKKDANTAIGFLNALVISPDVTILPTTSTNSITGQWAPQLDVTTPGTVQYTFTPYSGQCATTTTMSVTVLAVPTAPVVGTITQPTCTTPTGSVELSGFTCIWNMDDTARQL